MLMSIFHQSTKRIYYNNKQNNQIILQDLNPVQCLKKCTKTFVNCGSKMVGYIAILNRNVTECLIIHRYSKMNSSDSGGKNTFNKTDRWKILQSSVRVSNIAGVRMLSRAYRGWRGCLCNFTKDIPRPLLHTQCLE